ncbi:MAG: glutathione S-transferase N-terminal domain-containing protein [Burkholderiaceae bacterium]|nr:glutathione S-transferase N-terminal domain-containing protein [Burkholderiaceae bacterium]
MIDLYYWPTPNGWKLSIALEELGLAYRLRPVNIARGEQFGADFLAISPNNRIPALVDHDPPGGGAPISSFESGAMLIYLADKAGRLLPQAPRERQAVLSWLMWQMGGFGPMLGQHGHFKLYATEQLPYAIERYAAEARRLYGVLDAQLARQQAAGHDFVCGEYSIADIAIFPWAMTHKAQGFTLDDWPAVKRWYALLRAREAVQRGLAVGRELRSAQTVPDAEARKHLFAGTAAAGTSGTTP